MPRRSRTHLISQKKVRNSVAEPNPHGDMRFPAPQAGQRPAGRVPSTWAQGVAA